MNIDLRDGQTWYEYNSISGTECIVLISGIGFSSDVFIHTVPFFNERGFSTLRYDLFGRGRSSRPEAVYSLELYIRQLEQLVKKLTITQRFIVIGTSFGADIAVAFTVRNPYHIKKLVLLAPGSAGIHFPSWYPVLLETKIMERLSPLFGPIIGKFMLRKTMTAPSLHKKFLRSQDHLLDIQGTSEAMLSFIRCFLDTGQRERIDNFYNALKDKSLPAIALFGDKDRIIHRSVAATFTGKFPWLPFTIIPDTGHIGFYEQADSVLPILLNFINNPLFTLK